MDEPSRLAGPRPGGRSPASRADGWASSARAQLTAWFDPFLLLLLGTVATATLFPCRGEGAVLFKSAVSAAIVLLFFLHGAKLSRAAIVAGAVKWRLHLLVLATSFVLYPALGLIASRAVASFAPGMAAGVLFLALLPSTVQSSIAFTSIAGGDVPAAVCSASLSNLLGILVTPLLVWLLMGAAGDTHAASLGAVRSVALQLLLPFVAGHLSRRVTGGFIDAHRALVGRVDRSSILLVVYTAFSAAVVDGIWRRVSGVDLIAVLAASVVVLVIVLSLTRWLPRRLRMAREDEIVLRFCGSKKSLVSGVPLAAALFPAAQVGMLILPLMIFHQLQLTACAVIARRYAAEPLA